MTKQLFSLMTIALIASVRPGSSSILAQTTSSDHAMQGIAVAPQYDSTHVYVSPSDVDAFVRSFLGTFGGTSSKPAVVTVTPTPSSTISQLLLTPGGTVSLFGFQTPIPAPFGTERTGYLVRDMATALAAARAAGAAVVVAPFPDPIGVDAIIQWPGGISMQLYWHTHAPSYPPFQTIPENRVYLSPDRANDFLKSFLSFSKGTVVSDIEQADGIEIGRPDATFRRVRITSDFGKLTLFVTDGHLPYPYGRETTGYEVTDLPNTLNKATALGAKVLIPPFAADGRLSAMVLFPGGYIAEIHSPTAEAAKEQALRP